MSNRDFLDSKVLSRLMALPLFARGAMLGSVTGMHRSPVKGSSLEFAQYRKYVPGDDIRRLDWRAWGRSDRYYLKEFEADTNLRLVLLIDVSGSMAYGPENATRLDYARKLAGTLAWLAARQGELGPTYRVMNFVTSGMHQNAYRDLYATLAAPNPVASVPSIHMALTFLVLLWVRETAPKWTLPVLAYNLAMGFSLVYLGEHYVFDLLVGIGVATIGHYALRSRYVRSGPSDSAPPPDRGVLVPVPVRVDG